MAGPSASEVVAKAGEIQMPQEKKKRKNEWLIGRLARAYQGHVSALFCGGVLFARFAPQPGLVPPELQVVATKMTSLSYALPDGRYGTGADDLYVIGFLAIFYLLLRILLKIFVFNTLSKWGHCDPEKFTMQGWQFIYYLTAWVWGAWEYYHSEYFLDMQMVWNKLPHTEHTASFKMYYMCQTAFWTQMVFVTLIEKWQKDFIPMMLHHFITITLTSTSYLFNFTRVGHVVLVEQDLADIFLPAAKMFKYYADAADRLLGKVARKAAIAAGDNSAEHFAEAKALEASARSLAKRVGGKEATKKWKEASAKKATAIQAIIEFAEKNPNQEDREVTLAAVEYRKHRIAVQGTICDILFAVFAITWIPTRHGVFFWIYHSIYADAEQIVTATGTFGYDPAKGAYLTKNTIIIYLVALAFFQCLLIMWLKDLLTAVYKAIAGPKNITDIEDPHEADSDEDDDDEFLMEQAKKKA